MGNLANVHIGDIGTVFKFPLYDQDGEIVDISSQTNIIFTFEKPDTTQIKKDGDLFTDGKDGTVVYVLEAGLIDISGYWKVQVQVTLSDGTWNSNVERFKVEEAI